MGWGTNWGRVWGGSSEDDIAFALVSARASASNAFRVTFNKQPQLVSPLKPGDSSILGNWSLSRTDATQTLTILTVRPVVGDLNTIEFVIAQRWAGALAEYRITGSDTLVAADGVELITSPATADFNGSPAVNTTTEIRSNVVALSNPQNVPDQSTGGLVVGTNGDYQIESGLTLLKKLIIRRVFTAQNEFLHLANQTYGLGLRTKDLLRAVDLVELQARLKAEVLAEPEVAEAGVVLSLFPDGRMEILVKARTNYGDLEFSEPVAGLNQGVQF